VFLGLASRLRVERMSRSSGAAVAVHRERDGDAFVLLNHKYPTNLNSYSCFDQITVYSIENGWV
jgi:hypothetical protein